MRKNTLKDIFWLGTKKVLHKSFRKVLAPSSKESQKGDALIEFLITLPFLLTLTGGIYDISQMINAYLQVSYAVNSGARYAASMVDLSPGEFNDQSLSANCTIGNNFNTSHAIVQQRVAELIRKPITSIVNDRPQFCITSSLEGTPGRENVVVKATRTYKALFPWFGIKDISAVGTAPYIYSRIT